MTEGTSQGLFIVVAIVIFGIFVSLSYTLFGKTLQPQVVGLFNQAVETVNKGIVNKDNIIAANKVIKFGKPLEFKNDNDLVTVTSDGSSFLGAYIPSTELKPSKKYKISFTISTLEGEIQNVGGHMHYSENTYIFVNGVKKLESHFDTDTDIYTILDKNVWNRGVYLEGNKNQKVEVFFDTNFWDINYDYPINLNNSGYRNFIIEGNRHNYGKAYKMQLDNIKLEFIK